MLQFTKEPKKYIESNDFKIAVFTDNEDKQNLDKITVDSFGEEWLKFEKIADNDIKIAGDQYFDVVDDSVLNKEAIVLDLGCGTGRWSKYIADRVGFIEAVDPSDAVLAAAKMLKGNHNVRISKASIDEMPFADNSFDLIVCLGVLHHIPDTKKALADSVKKLKEGGKYLVYLYYNFENRGLFFKSMFYLAHLVRLVTSKLPSRIKKIVCDIIAVVVYMPIIYLAKFAKLAFPKSRIYRKIPLSYYTDKKFKMIRNDALDRFGTPLEQRFSRKEVREMMERAGLKDVVISDDEPYWHAVGTK